LQSLDLGLESHSIAIGKGTMLLNFASGSLFRRLGARKCALGRFQFPGKSVSLLAEPFVFRIDIGVRLPKPIDFRLEPDVDPRKLVVLGAATNKLLLMLPAF
jgi:hypothetical protein